MTASPPPIRVVVNDRQLPVVAVLDRGRVLVPLRAIVEALHIDVATIHRPLQKPARVIAGRWYAPVREMASLVHAQIQYDARAKLVAVYTAGGGTVAAATPGPTAEPIAVTGRQPASNSRVGSAYPTIAANLDLPNGSSIRSLRVLLDGVDETLDAIYQGTYVTYIPRAPLQQGDHTVDISGMTSSGAPFDTSWSFETSQPALPPDTGNGYGVPWSNGYDYVQLTVGGSQFVGGSPIPIQMIAPPGGAAFAFICTSTWQYQLFGAPSSQFYSGSILSPRVNYPMTCPITAVYVAPNGSVTYAPYPQVVQLLPLATPQPTPSPSSTRIPLPTPVATRSPAPSPTRIPLPQPTHTPLPLPVHKPKPAPTAAPRAQATSEPKPRSTARP